jgi:hypothetical protein
MSEKGPDVNLEPVVAHGSRMSWAGLLRPGDEFGPVLRSRLAVLTAAEGPLLHRFYGAWSARYRRFTTNLSSPHVTVRVGELSESGNERILCLLHWVPQRELLRVDPGGLCQSDGWPIELWQRFISEMNHLAGDSVCEKLENFADSDRQGDIPIVVEWRALIRGRGSPDRPRTGLLGRGWIPVPARLETPGGAKTCILSWSPRRTMFRSLTDALESEEARREQPDPVNQARYYLECMLSKLHGVTFGPYDAIEDNRFEGSPLVRKLASSYHELEKRRIADAAHGRLDSFG